MSDTLAALYLRVSNPDQHPETQLHDLRQMAAQRGLEIAGVYQDRITGARASRPGLDRLMSDARQGKFQVLVVWSCDRLAGLSACPTMAPRTRRSARSWRRLSRLPWRR